MSNVFDDFDAAKTAATSDYMVDAAVDSGAQGSSKSPKRKKKKSFAKKLRDGFIAACLTALLVAIYPVFSGLIWNGDYAGEGGAPIQIVIPDGASGSDIAAILVKNDVVKSKVAFVRACRADPRSASIQPGTYTLKKKMSAKSALAALLDPSYKAEIKITIPEGFTKDQVYERIASVLEISRDEVVAAASNTGALGLPDVAGGQVEGWFAPLTYTFQPGVSATQILSTMISTRVDQMKSLGIPQDKWQETLIKASILEREASNTNDYAKVARVIENRLVDTSAVNGLLQMDSTVLYGVGKTGGSPTQEELDSDTPYNTYMHPGLPPTPIGNPGTKALEGVCNPAQGDWLFFVTVNLDTGETKFSSTLAEHEQYVAEYRTWIANNPQ